MTHTKDKLTEPTGDSSGKSDAIAIFERAGWTLEDARWLGKLSYSALRLEVEEDETLDNATEKNLKLVADAAKMADPHNCRDRALLVAFARLCGCGGKSCELARHIITPLEDQEVLPEPADCMQIAQVFRSPGDGIEGANFEASIITGGWPGDYGNDSELISKLVLYVRNSANTERNTPDIVRLMRLLVDSAKLDLASVIDEGSLQSHLYDRAIPHPEMPLRIPKKINREMPPLTDARSLTIWMIGLGPRALALFFPVFQRCSNDESLSAMAIGVQDAIERWLMCGWQHWSYFYEGGQELAQVAYPYLEHLQSRCFDSRDPAELSQLRRSWLWFAWCVYEADPSLWQGLSKNEQEQMLRAANEDLSKLRPLFARAQLKSSQPAEGYGPLLPDETRAPWEEFKWNEEHFTTCATLLYQFGGVWRGMKPLLLAIRSFACPCVARDLRHWNDPADDHGAIPYDEPDLLQPPEPWAVVSGSMINLFHHYVGREQKLDSELVMLRGELARFCLDRLADRWTRNERMEAEKKDRHRTNEDMIEPSPVWRMCIVRAIASLHINPEGKGHRVLMRSSCIDPDTDVREAADAAYQQMRRLRKLPENVSPRRAVMSALWWIRQAHLLGLEIELDANGAQRTRAKELTRTKEMERADKLALGSMS